FVRKYGLGLIRPFPITLSIRPYVASGYIAIGDTIAGLAQAISIDPVVLSATIATYNDYVREGVDKDFKRGFNAYNRQFADPTLPPNGNPAPMLRPPVVALKIRPATLGTAFGLKTNRHAQGLDGAGQPIPGLYACGPEKASAFRGYYPGG